MVRDALSDEYVVHGLDVSGGRGIDHVADMTELREIEPAFEGVHTVIDLAADASFSASWSSVRDNNVPASLNALEAARNAGVRRLVYASSNHVVGLYERDEPYASIVAGAYGGLDPATVPKLAVEAPVRPDGPYGVGKAFGEAAARFYAETSDLSVICLRIGTVNREDRPLRPRHFATLLSRRDLLHLIRCCVDAPPSVRFGVFFGASANTWCFWDLEPARSAIGYAPQDNAESFR